MPAVVEAFNQDLDPTASLFWSQDVSRAYDTEAGRRLVWQWWLMEKMANWAGAVQNVKPVYSTRNWEPFVQPGGSSATQTPDQWGVAFLTRSTGNETSPVADSGHGYPMALQKWTSTYGCDFRGRAPVPPWDDIPASTEYPGFYVMSEDLTTDHREEDEWIFPDATLSLSNTRVLLNVTPGMTMETSPTVLYSTTPGEEFFISVFPLKGSITSTVDTVIVWGIAKMHNMLPSLERDSALQAGWIGLGYAEDRFDLMTPLHNGRGGGRNGHATFIHQPSRHDEQHEQREQYFSGSGGPNGGWESIANNSRYRLGMQVFSEQGFPIADMGDMYLTLKGAYASDSYSGRNGRTLTTQVKYNGNIYLCIYPGLYWKVS